MVNPIDDLISLAAAVFFFNLMHFDYILILYLSKVVLQPAQFDPPGAQIHLALDEMPWLWKNL